MQRHTRAHKEEWEKMLELADTHKHTKKANERWLSNRVIEKKTATRQNLFGQKQRSVFFSIPFGHLVCSGASMTFLSAVAAEKV